MPALVSHPAFYLTLGDARSHRSKHRNSRSDQDWTSTRCRYLRQSLSGIRAERVSFNAAGLSGHFLGPHGHVQRRKDRLECVAGSRSHINSRTGQHTLASNVAWVLARGTSLSDPELGGWVAGACSVGSLMLPSCFHTGCGRWHRHMGVCGWQSKRYQTLSDWPAHAHKQCGVSSCARYISERPRAGWLRCWYVSSVFPRGSTLVLKNGTVIWKCVAGSRSYI
jgi:hypothetical protein